MPGREVDSIVVHLSEHHDVHDQRYLRGSSAIKATLRLEDLKFLVFHPDGRDPILKIVEYEPERKRTRSGGRQEGDHEGDDHEVDGENGDENGDAKDGDYFAGAGDDEEDETNGNR